ncbi:MAG: MerR family transcriptional regulator [Mycobacteriaceae bacterium]
MSVAAVARRLGVAPATLRTWDRRYGLGPGEHAAGSHRRYGARDLARLERMQQALLRGAAPAEAARMALAAEVDDPPTPAAAARLIRVVPDGTSDETGDEDAHEEQGDPARRTGAVRVGGTVLRMPGAEPRARGLARAALSLDGRGAQQLLLEEMRVRGVVATWDAVVRPVLVAVAERWRYTGAGVEVEHLLSEVVVAVTARVVVEAPPPLSARPVLLGSMPGDYHTLPCRLLAAELALRRVATSVMGADLPVAALASAITRQAPAAVFLWSQLTDTAEVEGLLTLPRTRPRTRCFVGGPGWTDVVLPATVTLLPTLEAGCDALAAAAGR